MALFSVRIELCNCGTGCKQLEIIVDDISNQLVVGNVYAFSSTTDCSVSASSLIPAAVDCFPFGCYIVNNLKSISEGSPNAIIVDSYGTKACDACLFDNANYLVFRSCFVRETYYVPISQITPTPNIGDVYFLELNFLDKNGSIVTVSGCYILANKTITNTDEDIIVTSAVTQTDCQTCATNSPIVHVVYSCVNPETFYYISLPTSGFEDHLITFTDLAGLTQYCGIVKEQSEGPTNVIFVSDLGVYNDTSNNCEDCLAIENVKRELVNCLNPSNIDVVWSSSLFNLGDSTHLSLGNGCYEVSGVTTDPVTVNELANYDPQETCEDCLECYGVIYEYETCEPVEVCGPQDIILTSSSGLYNGSDFVIDSNDFAFVPFQDSTRVGKFNLSTLSLVDISPSIGCGAKSLSIDENNNIICLVYSCSNAITFIDYNNLSLTNTFTVSSGQGWKSYFDPIDGLFYVTSIDCCGNSQGIRVFSGTSYNAVTQVATFSRNIFGNYPGYKDIVRIGSKIYALSSNLQTTVDVFSLPGYAYEGSINLPTFGVSFDYDLTGNTLYIAPSQPYYIKLDIATSGYTIHSYDRDCGFNVSTIKINHSTDRIYITDENCNHVYEIQKSTDTLLRTYTNLNNDGISQVYGIAVDSSGNTWFSSYDDIFILDCVTDIVNGTVTSNEYLPVNTTFFNYELSACCVINSVQSITNQVDSTNYLSMLHYEDCPTCTGDTQEIFICYECISGSEYLLIAPQGQHSVGQFVRSQFGNSDWLCYEIVATYNGSGTYSSSFVSNGVNYTSCNECSSGATIGLTLINCDTLQPSQVSVTLQQWVEINGYPFSLPSSVVSDANGNCYQIANDCPIDNVGPLFDIQNFYFNQAFCRADNTDLPKTYSAGTEYKVCVICEDCCGSGTTSTSISVPHPTWTTPNGDAVVLLDAVALGGMFGLNS